MEALLLNALSSHGGTCSWDNCTLTRRLAKLKRKQKPVTIVIQLVRVAEDLRRFNERADELADLEILISVARAIIGAKTEEELATAYANFVVQLVRHLSSKKRTIRDAIRKIQYLYGSRCSSFAVEAHRESPIAVSA